MQWSMQIFLRTVPQNTVRRPQPERGKRPLRRRKGNWKGRKPSYDNRQKSDETHVLRPIRVAALIKRITLGERGVGWLQCSQQEMRLAPVVLTMSVLITRFPSLPRFGTVDVFQSRSRYGRQRRAVRRIAGTGSEKMMTASQGSDDGGGGHEVSQKRNRSVNSLFILRG